MVIFIILALLMAQVVIGLTYKESATSVIHKRNIANYEALGY